VGGGVTPESQSTRSIGEFDLAAGFLSSIVSLLSTSIRFVPVHLCNTKRNLLDIICAINTRTLACTNWTSALLLDVIPCVPCAFGCIHTLDETTATMITTLHQTLGVTAHEHVDDLA
jgi:hypothetical protein